MHTRRTIARVENLAGVGFLRLQRVGTYRRALRPVGRFVAIRPAVAGDLPHIARGFKLAVDAAGPEHEARSSRWVATLAGMVVGHALLTVNPDDSVYWPGAWLSQLAVRVPLRGLGIGARLTEEAAGAARTGGARRLSLLVDEDNDPALRLYAKLGFRRDVSPLTEELLARRTQLYGLRQVVMVRDAPWPA